MKARESFQRLRLNFNIDKEFYGMIEGQLGTAAAQTIVGVDNTSVKENLKSLDEIEDGVVAQNKGARSSMNMMQIFRDPLIRRIAFTVIALHIIQPLIDMEAFISYSIITFSMSFSAKMYKYMTITTTVVNFVSTIVALILIDRMDYHPLIIIAKGRCSSLFCSFVR